MKNFKRAAAAILEVVVLLAVCCLPMIFAFSGDDARGILRQQIGTVILGASAGLCISYRFINF